MEHKEIIIMLGSIFLTLIVWLSGIMYLLAQIHDTLKEIVMLQGRIQKPCLRDSVEALNVIARKLKELHGYG